MHCLTPSIHYRLWAHTLTHTLLPSLLLVPAVPRACSDTVHNSIAASPGSEAMVLSLTPRQSPSASLSLSPLLLPLPHSPSLPLAASLSSPSSSVSQGWRKSESWRWGQCECVCEECVWVWGLRAHWVGVRACLCGSLQSAGSLTHTHKYIHTLSAGSQRGGGTSASVKVSSAN